jgi:pimeloyl-ACP methyl ester carboxylesterase
MSARSETTAGTHPPRRPLIVFLHGTRLTGAQWAAQVEELSDEFECLALDLPGHGRAADVPFTLAGAGDAVAAAIERAGRGPVVLVGLSLGGYVAMEVAARWPDRVAGLVIAGATAEPVRVRSIPYRLLATAFDSIDERFLRALNAWFFRARYPAAIAEPIVGAGFHFKGGATAIRAIVGERFLPRLALYPGRTLVINGAYDLMFRIAQARFVAAAADARRRLIPGATHLSNLDRPEQFSAAVRAFAREIGAPMV